MASVYHKAYETEVFSEGSYVYIRQDNNQGGEDLIQLNPDQAAWLLAELESVIREIE
jgi:hypothetical protein